MEVNGRWRQIRQKTSKEKSVKKEIPSNKKRI